VLSPFTRDELPDVPAIIAAAADTVDVWLTEGIDPALRFANTWAAQTPTDSPEERR
jgi:hypothetical protein